MRRLAFAAALTVALAAGAGPAGADPYDPQEAGHPLRIVAYALHPAGVILDRLLFRPAHWLVHRHRAIETLFGHTD